MNNCGPLHCNVTVTQNRAVLQDPAIDAFAARVVSLPIYRELLEGQPDLAETAMHQADERMHAAGDLRPPPVHESLVR